MSYLFALLLTLPMFGGVEIEVRTKTLDGCKSMYSLINKQLLMIPGLRYELTDCKPLPR